MSPPNNPFDPLSRRNVLKTTGGLFAGATVLTGPGAAESEGLQVTILREAIVPGGNGQIPVDVVFPDDIFSPDDVSFPTDIFLGVEQAFTVDRNEEGEVTGVMLPENGEGLATPVRSRSVAGHEGHWLFHFRTQDIDFSAVLDQGVSDRDEITMGLAIIDGIALFDTDNVFVALGDGGAAAPDGVNGPVG